MRADLVQKRMEGGIRISYVLDHSGRHLAVLLSGVCLCSLPRHHGVECLD